MLKHANGKVISWVDVDILQKLFNKILLKGQISVRLPISKALLKLAACSLIFGIGDQS